MMPLFAVRESDDGGRTMTDGSPPHGAQALDPLDAMSAAPHHHEVLLENETVRVLDTRLAPGERTPVHTHQWPGAPTF
jgi:quercetin dioxygenase-like cupin family protein